jgi:hypothetical protein
LEALKNLKRFTLPNRDISKKIKKIIILVIFLPKSLISKIGRKIDKNDIKRSKTLK